MSTGLRVLALLLILVLTSQDGIAQERSHPQPRTGTQAGRQVQRVPGRAGIPRTGSQTPPSTTQALRSQTAGAVVPKTRTITPPGSEADKGDSGASIWTTFGWLSVILVGFVVGVRLWKKNQQRGDSRLVSGMIEVLGQQPLDSKHMIRLVRVGQRILVLGCSSEGIQTLSEVTEPDEIALLLGHNAVSQSSVARNEPVEAQAETGAFSQLLQHYKSAGGDTVGNRTQPARGVNGESRGGELHRHA